MAAKKQYKLDLMSVLQALDRGDKGFYNGLTDEEKKGYAPIVLMRYMSSLTDQSKNSAYAVLITNDFVNLGFWQLTKHTELQHLLLCLTGLGRKQFRPWLATKKGSKSSKLDEWIMEQHPELNEDELKLVKTSHTLETFTQWVKESGASDAEIKPLVEDYKKCR